MKILSGIVLLLAALPALAFNIVSASDSTSTDQVYILTGGSYGSIGISSISTLLYGDSRFSFSTNVAGGGGTGLGQSSYAWGFISDYDPHAILANVNTAAGPLAVPVWAPAY